MLFNLRVMDDVGFFDERFFLYYEDEDLCQRVFMKKKQIVLVPDVKVQHLSRSSVRGPNPYRSEFIRGFHHAQSKLIFAAKHVNEAHANRLWWKTLMLALASLVLRLLVPFPRYLSRLLGRICGLVAFKNVATTGRENVELSDSASRSPAIRYRRRCAYERLSPQYSNHTFSARNHSPSFMRRESSARTRH